MNPGGVPGHIRYLLEQLLEWWNTCRGHSLALEATWQGSSFEAMNAQTMTCNFSCYKNSIKSCYTPCTNSFNCALRLTGLSSSNFELGHWVFLGIHILRGLSFSLLCCLWNSCQAPWSIQSQGILSGNYTSKFKLRKRINDREPWSTVIGVTGFPFSRVPV